MIKGITVRLHVKIQTGTDDFGNPEYMDTCEDVKNVLVGEPTSDDLINELSLSGKLLAYTLAIPKGDTHVWEDTEVEFFGKTYKTFGPVSQGIDEMIPLGWNKKIKVEKYG